MIRLRRTRRFPDGASCARWLLTPTRWERLRINLAKRLVGNFADVVVHADTERAPEPQIFPGVLTYPFPVDRMTVHSGNTAGHYQVWQWSN